MKLKKIKAGHYKSADERVEIRKVISRQTYRADEILWELKVDGKFIRDEETKAEAVRSATYILAPQEE